MVKPIKKNLTFFLAQKLTQYLPLHRPVRVYRGDGLPKATCKFVTSVGDLQKKRQEGNAGASSRVNVIKVWITYFLAEKFCGIAI